MLRLTLFVLALFLAPLAEAANGQIGCSVDGNYAQTLISWDDHFVRVSVESPLGFAALPQFEAPISQAMIPSIEAQSKELSGLGGHFGFQWDKSNCTWSKDNEMLLSCQGIATALGAETGVRAVLMTTAKLDETSVSTQQSVLRVRFVFDHTSLYFVAIPFPWTRCSLTHN